MQLIWVAGPADKVVTFSITTRTVLTALAAVSSFLVLLGFLFHLIGLRVAVEYVPELAHRMGGVTSQSEQQRVEAIYREKLELLNHHLSGVSERLHEIEAIKDKVLGRLGIEKLLPASGPTVREPSAGKGGPMNLLSTWGFSSRRLNHQLDQSIEKVLHYDKTLADMQARWQGDLGRLDLVPTVLPLSGDFLLSSTFGVRADPLTHLPSMHEGIDFVAPVGTPVLATADGVVLRAEYAGAYGNMVELAHADGFVTRYAHLKTIDVKPQDVLQRHDVVGTLGNTGRSTGPHLHYEVIFKGRAMHPAKALAAWAQS
ncbi:M23 family metallopeptidase [Limnohabitans sp. 63ED37-2]|uniref:M23 family metallopeptidase n=1 Tax=Limnohabitans sp. 63ED37-2 TaxID=1678128 RepID=UPI0007068D3C|nr:M23 family metallopeptidase [Limnohabitans sp. 63ED37-2]ALK87325.1 Murein DD-endopeptidase MepM [Limnohabitans sp. 63ED37-2]